MQLIHQLDPQRMTATAGAVGYGYGLEVEQRHLGTVVSHRGGYPGFSAQMAWNLDTGLGVVALENASYALTPAVTALHMVMGVLAPPRRIQPWPHAQQARHTVEALLLDWNDTVADGAFATNMDVDQSRNSRRENAMHASAAIGLTRAHVSRPLHECEPNSDTPAHLDWTLRGDRGQLRCSLTMTSESPPLIQTLSLKPTAREIV